MGQSPSMVCYSPCPSGSAKVSLAMRRRTQFPLSFFLSKRKETGHGPAPFRPPTKAKHNFARRRPRRRRTTKAQHHFARRPRPSTISPTDQGPAPFRPPTRAQASPTDQGPARLPSPTAPPTRPDSFPYFLSPTPPPSPSPSPSRTLAPPPPPPHLQPPPPRHRRPDSDGQQEGRPWR